ncbi:isochorismate synthase DhbC [Paenibacillus sp. IHBB 10380]|uniref:isochorismate synthase DhbC n=1 Tax=Paenibacillus sp. IHBB 10380 TaxID=1566358 RepID=UPI0005CF9C34|nr:isochorismate synthase DhbC [Paenibacillus sp. IHBB 10380]AJS59354.1 isochorismate synthase [Paenibacillus sp. IHBB 10380]
MIKHDVIPVTIATQLLDNYQSGSSFFLSSPQRTLLAQGTFLEMPTYEGTEELSSLPERVTAFLNHVKQSQHNVSVVVGAVPFDHRKPAHLIVPTTIQWGDGLHFEPTNQKEQSLTSKYEISAIPEAAEYVRGVEQGLNHLESSGLRKVVLSRTLQLTSSTMIDTHQLLVNLARNNTRGYTFAVDLPIREAEEWPLGVTPPSSPRRTLIGASPELLVSRSGLQVLANPLAGSTARSEDPEEDQQRAAALLSSAKDLYEHALVVDAVAAALRPYCNTLDVPSVPSLVQTATMWHLSTEIRGELADPSTSALTLAVALHPTPAVCGSPTEMAREVIREIEPFDRGFYAGMVGWCDSNGDGEWVVTIRCAEVDDHSLRLFAGAGVVLGSSPEGELSETTAKFRTMLIGMGLNDE